MLTKPMHGWSDFQLDNTSIYGLSYLDDIAFEWIDQAIHGLETMKPFCVKGFLEPNRFLCMVSYWNCHIVCEDDGRHPLGKDDVLNEYSHTSMLQFCEYLYNDVINNIDEWVSFAWSSEAEGADYLKKKEQLTQKLSRLKELISESREYFGEDRCFL